MNFADSELAKAVRQLRQHRGESQTQFAHRLGTVLRTVARYEATGRIPIEVLGVLAELATQSDRSDLESLFRSYVRSSIGDPKRANRAADADSTPDGLWFDALRCLSMNRCSDIVRNEWLELRTQWCTSLKFICEHARTSGIELRPSTGFLEKLVEQLEEKLETARREVAFYDRLQRDLVRENPQMEDAVCSIWAGATQIEPRSAEQDQILGDVEGLAEEATKPPRKRNREKVLRLLTRLDIRLPEHEPTRDVWASYRTHVFRHFGVDEAI